MTDEKIVELQNGFNKAFINCAHNSNLAYRPQFIYNDNKNGQKVFSAIEDELLRCDSFAISVAFITRGGITPLLQTLQELERRGVPGRILTTDYLSFSDPVALDAIARLSNIELRMYQTERAGNGFHTKGYIFQKNEEYRFIIGSSNLTQDALTRNMEWNTKLVSTNQGEMVNSVLGEFEKLWNATEYTKPYAEFIEEYRRKYKEKQLFNKMVGEQKKITKSETVPLIEAYTLQPNSMQRAFIYNLLELRNKGVDKALLISATGTGKTYASAFAMRELGFKRVLFLVHRNQIAKQAKVSFEKVFGSRIKTGLVSGIKHDYEADFVFATVQTLSKQENLERFPRDYFGACIYDEAHHTSAGSYKKLMDYFTPEFTLGMTATPDKRDDNIEGRNIYEIFDHNIAYEIRLQQAMDENLLCPFHYFGITDLAMITDEGNSREEQLENFKYLTSDDRVKYIMEQAAYFGYSGERVKGLIFCSRIDEANELSRKFNEQGLRTIALSGADSEGTRAEAIERLTMDVQSEEDDYLDYIITVDIFSEGTDIVEVNQVIMLRPTRSPIVFIQQLGRGLRKASEKEYVVILDFIGNYRNNFMIPIALSGDRSYNKDNIRRYLMEGGRVIPGASTIHFDEISRKRIFAAVDNANFSDIKLIKENYANLKNKLGRIPRLRDFEDYGEMDVLRIFDNNSLGSYYKFLVKYEKEYEIRLTSEEEKVIEFVSKKLASGKRIQELRLLNRMLAYAHRLLLFAGLQEELKVDYGIQMSEDQKENIINIMTNKFPAGASKNTYAECIFIEKDDGSGADYHVSKSFEKMLSNRDFYEILKELIEFGISRYERDFSDTYKETDFVLYQKYTYEDVCRLLNWETNEVPLNIGGYKYDKECQEELREMFDVLVEYMYENLDAFGSILAADGKAIQSFATKISEKDSGNRGERDADWCRKTYTTTKPDGEKTTKTKKWFGFRLHLISDATYELPVDFEVTKASNSEVKETEKMLENMKEKYSPKIDRCEYFLADRGYDSTDLIHWLTTEGIAPIIDIRNCWQGEETKQFKDTELIYNYRGKVYYVPETGEPIELVYRGYDKSRDSQRYGFHPKYHDKRIFLIPLKTDPRIFTKVARNSKKWKRLYKKRTSIERMNGRIDRDFQFEKHTIRGLEKMKMFLTVTFIIQLASAKAKIESGNKTGLARHCA